MFSAEHALFEEFATTNDTNFTNESPQKFV